MSFTRLLLIAIIFPSLYVVVVALVSFIPHQSGVLSHRAEHYGLAIGIVGGIIPFSYLMLRTFRRIERHILGQTEMLALRSREMEALLRVCK